jgi:Tfp pilus assembly protein PilV
MLIPVSERVLANSSVVADASARRAIGLRKGFAMFMALGALVIVAVLIAGSSFLTAQEARLGQNQLVQSRALAAAEYGLNRIQADWDKTPNLQMANGAFFDTSYTISNQGTVSVRYIRLNNETFWIVSEGRATVGNSTSAARTAVKRVGAILRLRVPTITTQGSVTTAGNINAGGNANIRGNDSTPPGWSGCTAGAPKAALVIGTTATYNLPNGANASNVTGSPIVSTSTLASDSNTYVRFGDETWTALVAGANITTSSLSGGVPTTNPADGSCKKTDTGNWGEPWRTAQHSGAVTACNNYFPIVYVSTTASVSGGRGQGILLINGDFKMGGGFEWYGLVIIKDDMTKGAGTSTIQGSVMARNANTTATDNTEDFTGTANILYSGCSLDRALRGSAQVVQAKHRAWTEMY